jgi:3-deoxy-D-manno-octulosonic-acid transferase
MLRAVYNCALLLLSVFYLPKWLRQRKVKKPDFTFIKSGPRIWIHSISLGETKAVHPLIRQLKLAHPDVTILVSTITDTGYEESKKLGADFIFYLPLDFSWTIRKLMNRIKPDLLILMEGDFWFNLITLAPRVALINGRISEKSLSRFQKVPFFSRPLFHKIEILCVQSELFRRRFLALGIDPRRITVTGNLKFDQSFPPIDKTKWRHDLGLLPTDRVLTIGSTHDPEEELLLTALAPLLQKFPKLKILLVPRHPERFPDVAALLEQKGIDFNRFSSPQKDPNPRVILVDAMGVLSACYHLSELAIVGGSFITRLGGHNIFEPAALGVPVLFGPSMYSQKDLVDLVLSAGAGCQVTLVNMASVVDSLLSDPDVAMSQAGLKLASQVHGSTTRTLQALEKLLGVK